MADGIGIQLVRRARSAHRSRRSRPPWRRSHPEAEEGAAYPEVEEGAAYPEVEEGALAPVARPQPEQHDLPAEQTHLPAVDQAAARIRDAMRPPGEDADYDLARQHFDLPHFLLQARHLLERDGIDPVSVFLGNGADAVASPDINFDMTAYLARHPERAAGPDHSPWLAWVREGRAAGEIADPAPGIDRMATVLDLAPQHLVDHLAATRSDIQQRLRTGTLGEMVTRAAEIEPLIGETWAAAARPVLAPLTDEETVAQIALVHAAQRAAGLTRARLVVVASDPRWGGGRRLEGHVAHALTGAGHLEPADVVVIYTDARGATPAGRFPAGVREVDFAGLAGELAGGTDGAPARRALVELVRSLRGDAVLVVNSRLTYDALTTYGAELASTERIFLAMFGNERLALGNWVGIPLRFFHRCFDLVEGVVTDSEHLAGWLRERHDLSEAEAARVHVLPAPVDPSLPELPSLPSLPSLPAPADRRPQVAWAGRWDRQKRIDLAIEVARRMPEIDLTVWGEPVLTRPRLGPVPDNVTLRGRFDRFDELDVTAVDAWLYTAAWDGVPSMVLEVAMTGIPIVGSHVGGTGEVLDGDGAWPVAEIDDPDAYVAALRAVLADPVLARTRASRLRERLRAERTETAYADRAAAILLPPAPETGP
jgi:glycosyltransferase involved in cell wall biosynthesis